MHIIANDFLTLEQLNKVLNERKPLKLSSSTQQSILECYQYLHQKVEQSNDLFYGINTGFGSLCNIRIDDKELEELQHNLVRSHACGTGDLVEEDIVKIILLLKIKNLAKGFSGISLEIINRMVEMYNAAILPVIYELGSLGASGDLAPLAHLSLPLIGEGEVYYKGQIQKSKKVLDEYNWTALQLQMKEGLALLNGTQFSTAHGVWAMLKALKLSKFADFTAAMSIDAFLCRLSPYDERLHQIRPHEGCLETAANIRQYLQGSMLMEEERVAVQDPYAFRCVPQVHGATKDAMAYVRKVLETEINSATDNPNIFPESDAILSGGNFHAQPIALALDFLAIALAELGSISERRLYQLIGGHRNLPAFLTAHSGLHSGFMIVQYTAASIVSQNKQLCTPASVDSIVSCNGQEDHVSMAANAGTKLRKVVKNIERLLALEFMAAAQALSLRGVESSPVIQAVLEEYRKVVPMLEKDRYMAEDIAKTVDFISKLDLV